MHEKKKPNGILCPKCGHTVTEVIKTILAQGEKLRHRRCVKCKKFPITTVESVRLPATFQPDSAKNGVSALVVGPQQRLE